jgi:hypothetical protein
VKAKAAGPSVVSQGVTFRKLLSPGLGISAVHLHVFKRWCCPQGPGGSYSSLPLAQDSCQVLEVPQEQEGDRMERNLPACGTANL